jgi:hypothetical protein
LWLPGCENTPTMGCNARKRRRRISGTSRLMRPPCCAFKFWTCHNILDQCLTLLPFSAADWPREEQSCVQSPSISTCSIHSGKKTLWKTVPG